MTSPITFVLVVSDGQSMRTIHPAGMGAAYAQQVERIARSLVFPPDEPSKPTIAPVSPSPASKTGGSVETMTQREIALTQGYSGDVCASCGAFAMMRTGTCLTCTACGSTSGGCA